MALNFRQEFNDISLLVSVRLGSCVFFIGHVMIDKEKEKINIVQNK